MNKQVLALFLAVAASSAQAGEDQACTFVEALFAKMDVRLQDEFLDSRLEPDGDGTKLILQMDAALTPPGMPNMPGMEDMMKKQMLTGLDTSLQTMKKLIEG